MSLSFGSFEYPCAQLALPLCPVVNLNQPICYARNIQFSNQLIFSPATLVINFISIIMTFIMVYHIKQKYTAVGRKEIVLFFYFYALTVVLEFLLISGLIPTSNMDVYKYLVSAYDSLIVMTIWCLLLNGFVSFQWAEDGTNLSLWSIRISSLIIFAITFFINIATFQSIAGFSPKNPLPLFIIHYIFPVAMIIIYVILQVILVVNTLDDRWPLGDIMFGFMFFVAAKVFEYVFSPIICSLAKHYIDGMFLGAMFELLAVMMIYKYWDSITREDLEFSVGGKSNVWELKNPLLKINDRDE